MPALRSTKSVSSFVKQRKKNQKVKRASNSDNKGAMESGNLVDDAIAELKLQAKTEFGQPMRWAPYCDEVLEAVLDLRIAAVYTSGGAQISKSYLNALSFAYLTQKLGLRGAWVFPQQKLLDIHVPTQHKPLLEQWSSLAGATPSKGSQTSNRVYDVGLGRSIFAALGSQQKGGASAGSGVVSFTADFVFAEETSQCSFEQLAPIKSRVEQSISEASPVRYLGTPGAGGGIELLMERLDYDFWPHADCLHCHKEMTLHPFGCLLKPVERETADGQLEFIYLDEAGLPINWHGKDPEGGIGTPYFGCPHCGKEIADEVRQTARYKCIKTGLWWQEFRLTIPERWGTEQLEVGFWMSVLLRHKPGRTVASLIIKDGLNPASASDWCEQRLGVPSTASAASISLDMLKKALSRDWEVPKGWNTVKVGSADQGRSGWFASSVEFAYNPLVMPAEAFVTAKMRVKLFEKAGWERTATLLDDTDVILIDAKPTIYLGAQFCNATGAQMGIQVDSLKDDFNKTVARDAGEEFPAWNISNQKFPRGLIDIFASGRVSLPPEMSRYLFDKSVNCPFYQLQGPHWNSLDGKIEHASDSQDDYFYSLIFALAALNIYLVTPSEISRDMAWGWWG